MKTGIYSIYDGKACFFGSPMVFKTDAEAIRAFSQALRDDGNLISQYPDDFTLHRIGTWDDNLAVISENVAVPLLKANDVLASRRPVVSPSDE